MIAGWGGCSTEGPEETILAGGEFSRFVEAGDVFALEGGLAAGKTTFMKGIARGLGYTGTVTSPTFTLINEYHGRNPIIHIDCYRETDLQRWIRLGLPEYFGEPNIVFIEWADLINKLLPEELIVIEFENVSLNERRVRII